MPTILARPIALPPKMNRVPPLANGDRLSRDEFERRYAAMPDGRKAELIEGVVYMSSPVSRVYHGTPHGRIVTWLGVYQASTPGTGMADNTTVRLNMANEPQPDALLIIEPDFGGQARIGEEGYVEGAPELVAEVAATSASYDLHDKLKAYRRNGVQEYVAWRVMDDALDWFVLRQGRYVRLEPDATGLYRSEVFPGLWLDAGALLRGDLATVLRRLQEGLGSPEHAEFVAALQKRGGQPRKP